jgi:large subunit ribosomal protein L32e
MKCESKRKNVIIMATDHPKFLPQIFGRHKRIKNSWRKPRGIDSKKRVGKKFMGAVPGIGWQGNRKTRHLHPSGMKELRVFSPVDLEDASNVVIRIAAAVGARKRKIIVDKATSLGLRVLNPK